MISHKDILFFSKNVAVLIKSGVPLAEALAILHTQVTNKSFKKIVFDIKKSVENGSTLAKALSQHRDVFDPFFTGIVTIGEESGTLDESLGFLAAELSKAYYLRQKIQGALLYPALVFGATFVMGGFISLFILPQLVTFFANLDIPLPITTQLLLGFAKIMSSYGILIFSALGACIVLAFFSIRVPLIKKIWDRLVFRFPLFGDLLLYGYLARISKNVGVLVKSGVPLPKSLVIVTETTENSMLKEGINHALAQLKKGKQLSKGFEEFNTHLFTPLFTKMIETGEKTGKIDEACMYLGDYYEEEVDTIAKNLTTVLEPILLIIIGLIIGFTALAIIGPIYQLTGRIQ